MSKAEEASHNKHGRMSNNANWMDPKVVTQLTIELTRVSFTDMEISTWKAS